MNNMYTYIYIYIYLNEKFLCTNKLSLSRAVTFSIFLYLYISINILGPPSPLGFRGNPPPGTGNGLLHGGFGRRGDALKSYFEARN